ncbi:MAG TPA: hypothetical protein PLP98_10510 [Plasticicumulans sp.]|nr:hypothetical protein [Plasticicumulans sp.]
MPLPLSPSAAGLLSAFLLVAGNGHAAQITYLDQQRSAAVDAQVRVLDFGHGELQSAVGHDLSAAAPGDFSPFTAGSNVTGLFVSDYGANASADGFANHASTLAADGIRFTGDVAMYAAGSPGSPGIPSVSGLAEVLMGVRFVLDEAATLELSLDSDPNGGFDFRLLGAGASVVWDQTSLYSPATGPQFTFVIHLPLAAGEYRLDAALRAYSSFDNDTGYSATSFASFALTLPASVIAEPHPAMLLCAGLVATATAMRRRPRPLPLTTPLRTAAAV